MTRLRRIGVLGRDGARGHHRPDVADIGRHTYLRDSDHAPLLVDRDPQVPGGIQHLIEKSGTDPRPVMDGMAVRLETAGGAPG